MTSIIYPASTISILYIIIPSFYKIILKISTHHQNPTQKNANNSRGSKKAQQNKNKRSKLSGDSTTYPYGKSLFKPFIVGIYGLFHPQEFHPRTPAKYQYHGYTARAVGVSPPVPLPLENWKEKNCHSKNGPNFKRPNAPFCLPLD